MLTFAHDGLSIRYTRHGAEAGTGDGEPVVFLHNGGTSHAIWDEVLPRFSGYERFALDLLGFGASDKPGSGYELERHVAILGAFLDAVVGRPAFLVGNCMGSATSLASAIAHPERVRALVLVNVLTRGTFEGGLYSRLSALPVRAPGLVSLMSRVPLGATFGQLGVRSQFGPVGLARGAHRRPELATAYASASQSRALLEVLRDIPRYASLDRFEPPPGFPPICTIWGLENRVLRAEEGRRFVRHLRPAREEWLEGCGHLPMLERPERVAEIALEFFGQVPRDPERSRP